METQAAFFLSPLSCFIYCRKVEKVISINLNNAQPCPHLLVVINYSMLFCSHSACSIIVLTTVIEKLTPSRNIRFIQVSCISNQKNRAHTREDDGKVIVFFFSLLTICIENVAGGCGGWYFFSCLNAEQSGVWRLKQQNESFCLCCRIKLWFVQLHQNVNKDTFESNACTVRAAKSAHTVHFLNTKVQCLHSVT